MRKIILVSLFALLNVFSAWAYDFVVDDVYYNCIPGTDDQLEVTPHHDVLGYYSGSVVIPSTVKYNGSTYRVSSIGDGAFSFCSGLMSVSLPNGLTAIGNKAFYGCTGLTSVKIPNSVTSIKEGAFWGCTGLMSVTIPEGVASIGKGAFAACTGLTSVNIPHSVTFIGRRAFYGCSALTSVIISNSVTYIDEDAFEGCSALISVTKLESETIAQDLETELREYFYPFSSYHLYFRTPDNANATMTMVTEYVAGVDILNEVGTIGPRMKTKESFLAYLNSGGEMKTIMQTETPYYIDKERSAIVGVLPTREPIVLFILPSGSGLTKWTEGVEGETYTCTAVFTDISFWKDGEKLHRKAVKISKSTRLDNGTEVKEWSYWVKGLSKLATYGYWGDPNDIGCIERSLKIDNKPIIEVSKK